jgi:hypothetical protein
VTTTPDAVAIAAVDLADALASLADSRFELFLKPRDAHLEEFVEIGAEDREEFGAFEQRERRILREREHARVELEPGELAIDVARRAGCGIVVDRVHDRMVGGPGRTRQRRIGSGRAGSVAAERTAPTRATTFPSRAGAVLRRRRCGDVFVKCRRRHAAPPSATTAQARRK